MSCVSDLPFSAGEQKWLSEGPELGSPSALQVVPGHQDAVALGSIEAYGDDVFFGVFYNLERVCGLHLSDFFSIFMSMTRFIP